MRRTEKNWVVFEGVFQSFKEKPHLVLQSVKIECENISCLSGLLPIGT